MRNEELGYVRIFAWFKLLKLWAALRWDDTLGIPPSSMELLRGRGLRGKIVRSKTTGDGKRIDVQEFYVAFDSWLVAPGWLAEGWSLFNDMGRSYGNQGRDFLLPRPDRRMHGFRGSMVRYPDALSMSRALARELKKVEVEDSSSGLVESRKLILIPDVSGYWSEHSERVTMVSWAAALGVDPESRRRWGRWKPSTDEEYAKTTLTMVLAAQKQVAEKLRFSWGGADLVEDEVLLQELGAWLEGRCFTEQEIDEQLRRLRQTRRGRRWRRTEMAHQLELEDGALSEDGHTPRLSDASDAPDPLPLEDAVVDLEAGALEVSAGTFVLSIVGRTKRRTLHRVGSCYRKPGIHYKEFLVVGDNRPVLEAGERLCSSCFGRKDKLVAEAASEAAQVSDGQSVSSVSSSTSLGSQSSDDS